jgi:poly(A) polymerase
MNATADPLRLRSTATDLAKRLSDAGHTAYFAGGCVRDELLGRQPHDYDIATSATPDQVLALFPRAQLVGAHFGVVVVHLHGHLFEIATFRSDGTYLDGRRPDHVVFSSPEADAERRDFTVNGMFLDPLSGHLIDFVGGRDDLKNHTLRAIGNPTLRFSEDRLRLLRAVRFAASLDYSIDPPTWDALRSQAHSLASISIERIRDEFLRIMLHPNRVRGFDLLDSSGLLKVFLPEMEALKGCTQPPEYHPEGDVWIHTRLMLSLLPDVVSPPLVLSVLLHDIAKPATWTCDPAEGRIRFNGHDKLGAEMSADILRRLRFSNEVIDATTTAVANHMKFMHARDMRPAKVKRWVVQPTFPDELELHRVDCLGSNGLLDNWEFMHKALTDAPASASLPPRLLTGRVRLARGYPGGPQMAIILTEIQDAQLEGRLTSPEDATTWVKANHPLPPALPPP